MPTVDPHSEHDHDPVCGLSIHAAWEGGEKATHKGKKYTFCSKRCLTRFKHEPERFLGTPIITLKHIHKNFGGGEGQTKAVRGVDLSIWEGDFVAIVGASGSGKSTILNILGNLDKPSSGTVSVRGHSIAKCSDEERALLRSKTFGFVFQRYDLIPWLTAFENVTLPLIFTRKKTSEQLAVIRERFTQVDMGHRLEHRPSELSGGEQQRVALLRALANDPDIIFADEPTGNLDSTTGKKILDMLIEFNREQKKTLVVVTHDISLTSLADQVFVLVDGQIVLDSDARHHLYTH